MRYYSLTDHSIVATFKQAALKGIAPDKGLYFPSEIPQLPASFFRDIAHKSKATIAFEVIRPFINKEIVDAQLYAIVSDVLNFNFPLVSIEKDIYALELFHGPTLAFKDVGARFMARCLQALVKDKKEKITILVATSGDTGGAVANGFYDVEGIEVVILYPANKVSSIQEKQLTTLGKNIKAIEVEGSFDDCQAMVKRAFLDEELKQRNLTSANSINIARWLPQMFYYFLMYKQLSTQDKPIVVSVPSGNFGNICAGMLAKKMGLPIAHFVAATNTNDTVPRYMQQAIYAPKQTQETISNAMDVSDPSNFIRIQELYNGDKEALEKDLDAYSFTDEQTLATIKQIYQANDYIVDPHGAVGYLGLKKYREQVQEDFIGIFLETAHPVKFPECIEGLLGVEIEVPERLAGVYQGEKQTVGIQTYQQLKDYLLECKS
ncbi:threonine synthase [Myroides pelagicus]|uniref:threonine synthase n=1 Tax=Myroides pelagicus TaxID=270914 RepID=UPI002DBFF9E9|nr:threonine synthase [Myroides pelagicus]MEC4114036.1 threonine synthase [Myroides pelagicus]